MTKDAPDAKTELERLAGAAHDQGRTKLEAVCRGALAHIEALEAEVHRVKGNARKSALTKLRVIPAERRRSIARLAAQRRWHAHGEASGTV